MDIQICSWANLHMSVNQQLRDEIMRLHAQVCGALADPNRILILYSLVDGPRSVSELVKMLDVSQPTVSRHLQVLRDRNLVLASREGSNVYYSLFDQRIIQALDILRAILADNLHRQGTLVDKIEQ
jgi:DNA-binding transcriptional ArsR family regulator